MTSFFNLPVRQLRTNQMCSAAWREQRVFWMALPRITSDEQRLNKLASDLRAAVDDADLSIQHVFSAHLVLAGAGHIESSISHILSEYARIHGNETVGRFVEKTVARNNS